MAEDNNRKVGNVTVKNREELEIDNIINISAFDENYLTLNSKLGRITVEGRDLRVEDLNHDTGKIKVRGTVNAIVFADDTKRTKRGIFS